MQQEKINFIKKNNSKNKVSIKTLSKFSFILSVISIDNLFDKLI